MNPSDGNKQPDAALRAAAKAKLTTSPLVDTPVRPVEELMHDLQVHQIELEMQNEALRAAQIALAKSRDHYADLYEFAPAGYLTLTSDGLISKINLTGVKLLRMDRRKLLHRQLTSFVITDDQTRWMQLFLRMKSGHQHGTLELTLQRGDGTLFQAQLDCDGQKAGTTYRLSMSDISKRKRAEDDLRAAKEIAERADLAKSQFLAAASHDLRQPLAALSIYANVLFDKVAVPDQKYVIRMKKCVGSLSILLKNLLDLSKLSASVVKVNADDFRIADLLDNNQSTYRPVAEAKGLRLRCVPTTLIGHTDPVLLQRILGNFIDNALRYTAHGGIVVGCRRRQNMAFLEVWDSGIGIPADKTKEIFDEFKQLGDEARNSGGSGLGLAIAAKTATLLGLKIQVRSRLGRGSVFSIGVPLGDAPKVQMLTPSEFPYRSLRLAIVEDNDLVREALVAAMQEAGHDVISAKNGNEISSELGALPPDAVVSDYRLAKGVTGFAVISLMRAKFGETLPAIIITGDTDPTLLRSMADQGIVVLHKPLDLEELLAYLEDMTNTVLVTAK